MTQFAGLAAFPITPTDAAGRVDAEALRVLLKRLTDAGVQSIGLLGSTGLYPFFTRAERRRAIEIAVEAVAGTPLLVGIGAIRTDEAVQFGQDAKTAGASAALLAPVSYTPLKSDEVFTHFETVAQKIDLPVCIYNNPGTTHFTFTPDLIARLSQVPGIVAVKNPAPPADGVAAHLQDLRARTPDGFSLGYSVDWNATGAMLAGGDAWYSVLGGLFPAPSLAILAAVKAGDAAEARRLNERLQPLWDLFTEHSSLRVIYAAANHIGIKAELPRPLLPLSQAVQRRIADVLSGLQLA